MLGSSKAFTNKCVLVDVVRAFARSSKFEREMEHVFAQLLL